MLAQARTVEQIVTLAAGAQALAEELIQEAKRRTHAPPVACRAGCPWCCHLTVTTTVPEVIQISEYLKAAAGERAAGGLHIDTIDEYAECVRGLTLQQRAIRRLRCPIQDPDTAYCSLWPIRPLLCRSWTSADLSKCRQAFYEPTRDIRAPVLRVQRDIAQAIGAGIVAGSKAAGLEGGAVYLVDALQIALAEPDAGSRWLAGEPVFEDAEVADQCLVVIEAGAGGLEAPRATCPALTARCKSPISSVATRKV